MKQHFLSGFVKAAAAAGIPEDQIAALAQSQGLEDSAAPAAENAEPTAEELEQLIDQLSPEEVEELLQHLEGEQQNPQLPELAQAIEAHVGANPQVAEMLEPREGAGEDILAKQSAVKFIKSAAYVEGFLEQALNRGIALKVAVDLYDDAFSRTFNHLKVSELEGDQKKLDVDNDGKIEGEDLKKLREDKKDEADTKEIEDKTAAYYEGMLEQARSLGFSDGQALEIVKAAASRVKPGVAKPKATSRGPKVVEESSSWSKGLENANAGLERFIKRNPKSTVAGGIGLGAAGASLAANKEEKK